MPFASRSAHPRFFAYVPFAGTWPGALGDFVASACNVYAGSWQESAGPTQLELRILEWFKEWVGYPASAGGSLVNGGSAANLTALACARESLVGSMRDDLIVYASDQAHYSVGRAARTLGFRPDQLRVLPVRADLRLDPAILDAAIIADEAAGRLPLLVVANGGATSTGAVDPLDELAAVCRERGVWLHVDAAYGGFAVLTDRGRAALKGIALADSVTLDPHKWLYQPYECGCLLVRDGRVLRRAFEMHSDYLRDAEVDGGEVNFSDLGIQLTRSTRAFKLWLSLRTFGVDAFRAAIDRTLDLADLARRRIEASESFELAAPPSLGIVCFFRRGADDKQTDGLAAALEQSGLGFISTTRVHGRTALRLCILNHTSRADDVERVLEFLETAEPRRPTREYERHEQMPTTVPLFARLDTLEARAFAALSTRARSRDRSGGGQPLGHEPRLLRDRGRPRRRVVRRRARHHPATRRLFRRDRGARVGGTVSRARGSRLSSHAGVHGSACSSRRRSKSCSKSSRGSSRRSDIPRTDGCERSCELRRADPACAQGRDAQSRPAPNRARVRRVQRRGVGRLDRNAGLRI